MTWLWVLPLVVLSIGLATVAVLTQRAAAELRLLRVRTTELRTQQAAIAALRDHAAAVTATAARLPTGPDRGR